MKMKNGLACFVFISKEDPTREFTAENNNKLKQKRKCHLKIKNKKTKQNKNIFFPYCWFRSF
jgi:hypothetical protein